MSIFSNVEKEIIPNFFFDEETMFLKIAFRGTGFFKDLFNMAFEVAYENNNSKEVRIFDESDFNIKDIQFTETERTVFIDLPVPEFENDRELVFLKKYCVPYLQTKDKFKILGLYAIQGRLDNLNENYIIKFSPKNKIVPLVGAIGEENYILTLFYKMIFKNYNPYKNRGRR